MTTIGGQILRFPGPRAAQVTPGVVTLADGIVKSIEFGAVPSTIDFGGPNHLVCPGFIDTHVHLPQFDSIGAVGMPLLPWLEQVIFPAEILWNDVDYARAMVSRVIDQFLSHGTTAVCAYATVSHEATVAAIEAFASAGFRGAIGQTLIDRGAPNELMRETDLLVDQVSMTLDAFPPAARMATAVTPRYALSCTEPLMLSAGQLAKDHDAIIQTHLA
ncbi:MAG: amidohydrolase family protein, partial [Planctomycetota bacterium]